jgi:hypothetical protein
MSFKVLSFIENMFIKFFLFFFIINLIIKDNYQKKEANQLENYYIQSICKLFYFTINYDCSLKLFTSTSFYNEIVEINRDINLLINIKKSKLENIFLLLCIIPFLKNNSTLSYKIKNKEIDIFFKKTFKNKRIKHKTIKFDYNDFNIFNGKINELLNYNWELSPVKFMMDNLNYIINNYYNEQNIEIFQKSLNMNFKKYIQSKKKALVYKDIESLLSKCSH